MKNDSLKRNQPLADELLELLETITYGSLEVYVQDRVVTQITVRNIKKTKVEIKNIKSERSLRA